MHEYERQPLTNGTSRHRSSPKRKRSGRVPARRSGRAEGWVRRAREVVRRLPLVER